MSQKNGNSQREKWVKTKLELARLLGISRTTLDNYTLLPGFPARAANGHFPLEQCRAFVAGQLGRNEEKRALELERLRDEVALGRLELGRRTDELMPREWCEKTMAHLVIGFRRVIESSGLTEEQKETMYSGIEKIDCDKFLADLAAEWGAPGASNGEADEG
jgi:hypothetical protein